MRAQETWDVRMQVVTALLPIPHLHTSMSHYFC